MSPACLISRVEREIILDSEIQAARKSDFQYVRTFTDRCQLGFKPCTNQTNKAEINLNDSLAVLAHEMYLLLRRQYFFLTFLVFKLLCFGLGFFWKCLVSNETSSQLLVTFCDLSPSRGPHFLRAVSLFGSCHEPRRGRHGWLLPTSLTVYSSPNLK